MKRDNDSNCWIWARENERIERERVDDKFDLIWFKEKTHKSTSLGWVYKNIII